MSEEEEVGLPSGQELKERLSGLSRTTQSELWRKMRRGETSGDPEEARLIAAMARERLNEWTMRPEIIIPAFVGFFLVLSLVWDDFSFTSSLTAPLIYAVYLMWLRSVHHRAFRRSKEVLRGEARGRPGA